MRLFKSKYFFDCSIALLKNKWLPFVLGLPLFFCLHHYNGIVGDARLYLLQVIHKWQPERFVNDPPFMFGNQDSYSVFSSFYSFVLKLFPISEVSFFFTLIGQSFLFFAFFYFIRQFSRKMQIHLWFCPLLFCFIFYSGYNMPNDHIFFWSFIERFNASRLLSLAIAVWGLGFLLQNRKYISLTLFLFGTVVHPITAGWCLPLWLFLYYPKTRVPVTIFALFFPLTYLLHKGPFDIYPNDWGNCTHDHPVTYLMLWREAVAVFFLGFIVPRFTRNENLLKFSKATFGVMLIGFYWSATGGVAKHIFIYQVQTWRVEWLLFVLAMPILFYLIYEQIQLFHHKKVHCLSSHHIALVLVGFTMLMPAPCSGSLFIAIALLIAPVKKWNLNLSMLVLSSLCLISASLQELIKNLLWGTIEIKLFNVTDLFRSVNNLLFLQLLLILGIVIKIVYEKVVKRDDSILLWIIAILLLIYIWFPQFQLLPILLLCFALYCNKRINLNLFIPILLLCLWDCLFNTEMRETNVLIGFPRMILNFVDYVLLLIVGIIVCFLDVSKTTRLVTLVVLICILTMCAYIGYDKRDSALKRAESNLNRFRDYTIFPQIKERDKMFYYVQGDYVDDSRVQFLTGSYFGETTPIGEPLFQKQFEEERKRLNYIFFKEQRNFIARRGDWRQFVKDSLSQKNILLDRVSFLCSINEITHLVSNLRLKELEKQDSYKMNENETIYLYGCSNATN